MVPAISGFGSFFIDKLIEYLSLMNKSFEVTPEGIIVHEKIDTKDAKIVIQITEKWIRILTNLGKLSDIPEEKRMEFIEKLMNANWNYPEISFGLDEEGNIYSMQDEFIHALYYDVFEEEYNAVIASIGIFEKIKDEVLGIKQANISAKEKTEQS